jgi:putative serine protease PepD
MTDDLFWPGPNAAGDSGHAQTEQLEREPLGPQWGPPDSGDRPRRDRPTWVVPAAAAGAAALVFGGAGIGIGAAIENGSGGSSSGLTVASDSGQNTSVDPKSYAGIAAKVLPSVVSINVSGSGQQDTGSGVILQSDGYILTNNHVVSAAANGGSVSVAFNDGSSSPARIVGTDQEDDLAVVKVAKTGLPAATLGRSASIRVGDPVLAVGSPLGLQGTVTSGIVSSLNRPVDTTSDQQNTNPFGGGSGPTSTTVISAIQTDAAINPGNSGGPLVDANGNVIGINSAIASTGTPLGGQAGNIGVGFAIPIDQASVIAQELIKTGHASHPLLGVSLSGNATDSSGNPIARVLAVSSGGPAQRAGIQVGDVVVAVDGQPTAGTDAVIAAIRTHQPGQTVQVTVERNGARKTVSATLIDAASPQG